MVNDSTFNTFFSLFAMQKECNIKGPHRGNQSLLCRELVGGGGGKTELHPFRPCLSLVVQQNLGL